MTLVQSTQALAMSEQTQPDFAWAFALLDQNANIADFGIQREHKPPICLEFYTATLEWMELSKGRTLNGHIHCLIRERTQLNLTWGVSMSDQPAFGPVHFGVWNEHK